MTKPNGSVQILSIFVPLIMIITLSDHIYACVLVILNLIKRDRAQEREREDITESAQVEVFVPENAPNSCLPSSIVMMPTITKSEKQKLQN